MWKEISTFAPAMRRLFIFYILYFVFSPVVAQKQDVMKQTVEYLASQELGGRFPATVGDTLASEFIVSQLSSLKLKPIVKGKKKTAYFQDFTYGKTKEQERTTHNIIAVLPGNDKQLKHEYIVVGSHYDHLGLGGQNSGSRRPDTLGVHPGADDNASGDAVVLELAKYFKKERAKRSIIFAFFGAEEQGLIGSKNFLEWMKKDDAQRINLPADKKGIVAMVNLDMVGRMRDNAMSVSGTGTSSEFKAMAEAEQTKLNISCTPDGYGPSDHASFVAQEIPVLFLTTGGHMEYHTPDDVPSTLNYDGMQQTLDFSKLLITQIANMPTTPDYISVPSTNKMKHGKFKVTLGLMPDVMGASRIPGLRADIVVAGKSAHNAGIRSGDIIQEIDGKPVTNMDDYMQRLSELEPDTTVPVKVLRNEEIITFQVHLMGKVKK